MPALGRPRRRLVLEPCDGELHRAERPEARVAKRLVDRAELLRRAISQTREKALKSDIDAIADLLGDESFGDAIEKQESSVKAMAALLRLLQSEDRRSALEKERERLNELLKGVRNAIAQQRATRSRTQNSQAPSNAAPGQQKAIEQTDE